MVNSASIDNAATLFGKSTIPQLQGNDVGGGIRF
jgi:hypothetical protein